MQNNQLNRKISLLSLVAYYISTVVGVGIFLVPMTAAKIAGPASIISWVIVLMMIYPFAQIFAHISQQYQVSGSVQKFLEESTSPKFGRAIALFVVISAMFGNFLLGNASANYLAQLFNFGDEYILTVTLIVLLVSCAFNLINLGTSSKIQTSALAFLILILSAIVIASIPHHKPQQLTPFFSKGYEPIFAAILICFYSVVGWENIDSIAEEVKNPKKTYDRAIKIAIALIAALYLAVSLTVILVISEQNMHGKNTVLSILLQESFGLQAAKMGSFIAITLLFLGANAWILGTSRMIFALAREGGLPKFLTKINSKTDIPVFAVISQNIFYAFLALVIYITNLSGDKLIEISSLNYLMFYMIIFFCGVKHFKSKKMKNLSTISLLISSALIINCANQFLVYSLMMLAGCFSYIFLKKRL